MANHQTTASTGGSSATELSKKDEFRKYLEKTGVMDALTKVLVGLYEEPDRPTHALEYVKKYLGATASTNTSVGYDAEGLRQENEQLKRQVDRLTQQLQQQQSAGTTNTTAATTTKDNA